MNYQQLKDYYNNTLNKKELESPNDEPTPIECVEEMIQKIPTDFWKKDIKILDPCCGFGNFFIVIRNLLLNYHNEKYILKNMLFFNDINQYRLDIAKKFFKNANITNKDFLTDFSNKVKYDLIVANPPYAKFTNGKRTSKNHNLIKDFINKSFELLNENGYILFITPDNWTSYADRNELIKKLTEKQIIYLNIHTAKKYFKKIGSSFTWYIIQNTKAYKDIQVEGIWKNKIYTDLVPSQTRKYIPLLYNNVVKSILAKTIDADNKKFNVETSCDLHRTTKKHLINNNKNKEFRFKLIHTPKQTVWANRPHKFQDGYKVFISTTSYYGVFVDSCGMTQSIAFIRCENGEEADQICQTLEHSLYKFINNICRWGNFNNVRILQSFPYCDCKDVYGFFGISENEVEFIEKNL